jgi:hypothetical protein
MKQFIQPAVIAMIVVAGFSSCKKETVQDAVPTSNTETMEARPGTLTPARNLVKKGTDSLVYNAGGTLTKVIYNADKYVSYVKSGNMLTASTFEGNVLKSKVEYTINNGRATQSKHTSYESTVAVTKTWIYLYNNEGRLYQKYNKNNSSERMNFLWVGADNLTKIKWYSPNDEHIATLQFTRNAIPDKLKINSVRSTLDPYLKIFGVPCGILSTGEGMSYTLSPASNFSESFTFSFDRDGYPVKVDIFDPSTWTLKSTQLFGYSN